MHLAFQVALSKNKCSEQTRSSFHIHNLCIYFAISQTGRPNERRNRRLEQHTFLLSYGPTEAFQTRICVSETITA